MNEKANRMRDLFGPIPPGITDAEIIAVFEDTLSWKIAELRAAFVALAVAVPCSLWTVCALWALYIVIYLTLEYLL